MLFTVSTVKDSLRNLERFVVGNLAGGVDHMIVFVDAPLATEVDALAFLDRHPSVTCVRTDDPYWQGKRPKSLNFRQRINANFAKAVLSKFDWAEWVFHVDGDEIVQIDRSALASAPPSAHVVRLAPLEAVSQWQWGAEPTLFKRLLDPPDLMLLHQLGVIERPQNGAYFHGHVAGKVGMRPALDLWLRLHDVVDAAGMQPDEWVHPGLRVLHYESFSGEEFVRKWTSLIAAGPTANFRAAREPRAVALRSLLGKELTAEQRRAYLVRLYQRTTEDDLMTLRDLELLEDIDPRAGTHEPANFPDRGREQLDALITRLATVPKQSFRVGGRPRVVKGLIDTDASPLKTRRRLRP